MKKYQKITRVYFQIILFLMVTVNLAQAADPIYDGRSLSEWLLFNSNPSLAEQYLHAGSPTPAEAIRQIGTNGIPNMIDLLSATKSNKKRELMKLQSSVVEKLFEGNGEDIDDLRSMAVGGFAILGTNAEPAIPQLIKLFHHYDETCFQTIRALNAIGPKGFAVLTNAMNDPDPSVRNNLIWVIGEEGGGDPKLLTQLLINALKDPEPSNRGNAANSLAGKDPAVAIPALTSVLDDKEYYPLVSAASSLASYGPAARSATPKLLFVYTNVLSGTNQFMISNLSVLMLGDMRKIDPETAGKAEDFLVNSGPLNATHIGYTTTLLPNGKELIAGGYVHTEFPTISNRGLSTAELYDLDTGKWAETGKMKIARWNHAAILLHNGNVLVVGGSTSKEFDSTSAELYDPITGAWAVTGSLNDTHRSSQVVLRPDGRVWIKGGWTGSKMTDDELYDPTTGKWTILKSR